MITDVFWELKTFFPGDPEFQLENFHNLPYEYVYIAHRKVLDLKIARLNDYEKPIAALTCLTANINKDKKTKPFAPEDFYVYKRPDDINGPAMCYGASYLHLIKTKQLPSWALFCYKEVSSSAGGAVPPLPAIFSENAVLLAPARTEDGYKGMLIAREKAKGLQRFTSPCGVDVQLIIEDVPTKVVAIEGVELRLLR